MLGPVDLTQALGGLDRPWSPLTVAVVNDYDVRVVYTHGEFTRHTHPDTDEFFLVLDGALTIRLDDGEVHLGPGQAYVVPRGVSHRPVSPDGARVLLFEPTATVNTGDNPGELTAQRRAVPELSSSNPPPRSSHAGGFHSQRSGTASDVDAALRETAFGDHR